MAPNTYRTDIDGLRAIAVLLVILFHLDMGVSGGYVGVDVFFVISGYLITGVIRRGLSDGNFSIAEFYASRARRILPVLLVVILVTSITSCLILLPTDLERFGKSVIATLISVSNFWFLSNGGYFDPPSALSPLLHTWSLGIESQFYILFPLTFVFLSRWSSRRIAICLIFTAFVTFIASAWFVSTRTPQVFFLAPFRAWEFLLGALLLYFPIPKVMHFPNRQLLALIGLGLIVVPGLTYSGSTVFPGTLALFPCLGAAILIWVGNSGENIVTKLLKTPIIVFLGLISYSLYLWHWPLLVFTKYVADGNLKFEDNFLVGMTSLILAALTWKFVEIPFRSRLKISNRRTCYLLSTVALSCVAIVTTISVTHGLEMRFNQKIVSLDRSRVREVVRPECIDYRIPLNDKTLCRIGALNEPTILILGDSFAHAILLGFDLAFKKLGVTAWFAAESGCAPLPGTRISFNGRDNWRCRELNEKITNFLSEQSSLKYVILVAAWDAYSSDSFGYKLRFGTESDASVSLKMGMESFAQQLHSTLKIPNIIVVSQVPSYDWSVPQKMLLKELKGETIPILKVQDWHDRTSISRKIFEQLHKSNSIDLNVDSAEWFCSSGTCQFASDDNQPFYWDGGHINKNGALFIAPIIEVVFRELIKPPKTLGN